MDAVCFDMDGVLVDSEDYWVPREREDLLPELLPDDDIDIAEITGMNYRDIYDYLAANYEVAASKSAFLSWYDETAETVYGGDVDVLPGAHSLLTRLGDCGTSVALVSSSPPHWIEAVVGRFDLSFDKIVSADAVDMPGKPAPDIYDHAADLLGVSPEDTIAVEDSGHGIEAARRAGMHVVGFRHGDADNTDLGEADVVAPAPSDLREHLLGQVE